MKKNKSSDDGSTTSNGSDIIRTTSNDYDTTTTTNTSSNNINTTFTPNCQVRVGVRVRPITSKEHCVGGKCIITSDLYNNTLELSNRRFTYDSVFDTNTTQIQLYQTVSKPLLNSFLDGYNATVSI